MYIINHKERLTLKLLLYICCILWKKKNALHCIDEVNKSYEMATWKMLLSKKNEMEILLMKSITIQHLPNLHKINIFKTNVVARRDHYG